MSVKGYVVRGKGTCCAEHEWAAVHQEVIEGTPDRAEATEFSTPREAFAVATRFEEARILAIAEDGTETPLPSYEEALKQIGGADAVLSLVGHPPDGRPLVLRIADAMGDAGDKLREALAETERLRTAEHKAWARLLRTHVEEADALRVREDEYHRGERLLDVARQNQGAAEQVLRDLGVDVDTLLRGVDR